jgi:lipid-binding SYLF domain-containing protein
MKKLIALFATTAVASGSAMGAIALSGTASVSYDDNGSAGGDSFRTSYDADLSIVGTAGSTTLTAGYDMEGASLATTGVDSSYYNWSNDSYC